MNIFVTSDDPRACAEALDDKRLIKMILESAQILCTIVGTHHSLIEQVAGGDYKPTHVNHPCTVWARSSQSNALWLYAHAIYMCEEYTKRFAKVHKSQAVIEGTRQRLYSLPDTRKDTSLDSDERRWPTSWVNVSAHQDIADVFAAYRITLNDKWDKDARRPLWTNRKPPSWARWNHLREVVKDNPVVTARYHYRQANRAVIL